MKPKSLILFLIYNQDYLYKYPETENLKIFFFVFFDENFFELLGRETNNHAESELLHVGFAERFRISRWKPMVRDESFICISLVFHTGTIRLNLLNGYWKKYHYI